MMTCYTLTVRVRQLSRFLNYVHMHVSEAHQRQKQIALQVGLHACGFYFHSVFVFVVCEGNLMQISICVDVQSRHATPQYLYA